MAIVSRPLARAAYLKGRKACRLSSWLLFSREEFDAVPSVLVLACFVDVATCHWAGLIHRLNYSLAGLVSRRLGEH